MSKNDKKKSLIFKIIATLLILVVGAFGFTEKIPSMTTVIIIFTVVLIYHAFDKNLRKMAGLSDRN